MQNTIVYHHFSVLTYRVHSARSTSALQFMLRLLNYGSFSKVELIYLHTISAVVLTDCQCDSMIFSLSTLLALRKIIIIDRVLLIVFLGITGFVKSVSVWALFVCKVITGWYERFSLNVSHVCSPVRWSDSGAQFSWLGAVVRKGKEKGLWLVGARVRMLYLGKVSPLSTDMRKRKK